MFVKYPMGNPKDYRGNVKLVVKNGENAEIAYSSVEETDPEMVELSDEEIVLVKGKTNGRWTDSRTELKYKIDVLADEIRRSHLEAGYATIDLEYLQVENELAAWEGKGKPVDDVPADIDVWREVTGQDLEWTVNDIKAAINKYRQAISSVRRIRLKAKTDLSRVPIDDINDVYLQAVTDLEALRLIPAPT